MRLAWMREKQIDDINENINRIMSVINEGYNDEDSDIFPTDESKDDDALLAKYDINGNYIRSLKGWSQATVLLPLALVWEHRMRIMEEPCSFTSHLNVLMYRYG